MTSIAKNKKLNPLNLKHAKNYLRSKKMKLGCLEALIRPRTYKDIFQTKEQAKNTFKMGNSTNQACIDR